MLVALCALANRFKRLRENDPQSSSSYRKGAKISTQLRLWIVRYEKSAELLQTFFEETGSVSRGKLEHRLGPARY